MNTIIKRSKEFLGYQFVPEMYLPAGKNEYYLRFAQNPDTNYRKLKNAEIETLVRNGNNSDDWDKILVKPDFNPSLVRNSRFFGLVRIGKLEPVFLEFHNLKLSAGIYNSTVISTDIGDNVCIENVTYLSHYIIGNEVMLTNINELATTDHSKFGNGILKDGENESVRIWLELRNENAGRRIIPFDGMLPGDAKLWSDYPEDKILLTRLLEMTGKSFPSRRGYYGTIGDRTVIKDCSIIKDVKVGTDAYIKGANKLKNLTINSNDKVSTQIGEGCELVNGIVEPGCRIFYGVKAVRFVMGENSQLKYGARLINSYLGSNSTISCCEVLNSLIFPGHEQHHNNSFLVAALTSGQSNIAAGATIGSNHNSRAADGEVTAARGFWPGLSVSLKHDSRFASFCILSKGSYAYELDIPIPFTLVSNDESNDKLILYPGYWFYHNMYALARNRMKFEVRDKRNDPVQLIEYDYLAPDTVNELFDALRLLEGLQVDADGNATIDSVENSHRICVVKHVNEAVRLFKDLIFYYSMVNLIDFLTVNELKEFSEIKEAIGKLSPEREHWENVGGQLIPQNKVDLLVSRIKSGEIDSWDEVHRFYKDSGEQYRGDKWTHAVAALFELEEKPVDSLCADLLFEWANRILAFRKWLNAGIRSSRKKDYDNPFRKMMYTSKEQMDAVLGSFESNSFIQKDNEDLREFELHISRILNQYCADHVVAQD